MAAMAAGGSSRGGRRRAGGRRHADGSAHPGAEGDPGGTEPVWRRTEEWLDPEPAAELIRAGAAWAVQWCEGDVEPADALPADTLRAVVLPRMVSRRRADRLARKRSVPTVMVAERWEDGGGHTLVVFHEGGPYPRVDPGPGRWPTGR
ncbi:hypothetical protein [Allostreptomyces psammosilenae]|uniref:Uncharacterized protein n=1 Tax=Allostreptomyces psammosilenae TaxID=1892865 RepID=A0A852ZX84_9ACTN|nr:hypothetical protein [Allostreptomyces psammosilenae]NYI07003.1 hypothetical protein [Allostreptomyces psammosilenae]